MRKYRKSSRAIRRMINLKVNPVILKEFPLTIFNEESRKIIQSTVNDLTLIEGWIKRKTRHRLHYEKINI